MIHGIVAAGGGAVTPALWTPADLTTPAFLWANEDSDVTDAGSGACSQWDDLSGGGHHFQQGSSIQRPLIVDPGLNGMRTIRFDGGNDRMSPFSSNDIYRNKTFGYLFVVMKKLALDGSGQDRYVWHVPVNGSTTASWFAVRVGMVATANLGALSLRRLTADSVAHLTEPSATDTNWHMVLCIADWANGDGYIWRDGDLVASNLSMTTSGSTSDVGAGGVFMGMIGNNTLAADVEIAEVIASGTDLSGTEIDKLFGYAAHKWGLAGNLDVSHPYKSSPP